MSRLIVYQSGGFTNDGIGYRMFSQEELEEISTRQKIRKNKVDNNYENEEKNDAEITE